VVSAEEHSHTLVHTYKYQLKLCNVHSTHITALKHKTIFDVHESVHRYMIMKLTNNMQLYRLIYYS